MLSEQATYRLWWEQEMKRRFEVERILDCVLGGSINDGAGNGVAADVALAIERAWDQGYAAGINRAHGLDQTTNPYTDLDGI